MSHIVENTGVNSSKSNNLSKNKKPNRTVETDKYLFFYSKSKFTNNDTETKETVVVKLTG